MKSEQYRTFLNTGPMRASAPTAAFACFVLAAFFEFGMVGYRTTALAFAGVGLCVLFYWFMNLWKAPAAKVLRAVVTGLLVFGCACFAAAEIPIIAGAHTDTEPGADYIIVMGAGVNGAEPSLSMTDRLEAALDYLQTYPESTAIVSGCQGDGEDVSEAEAMRVWLEARGVAPARIIKEETARSSYENILRSLDIIESLGGDRTGKVAIVSSEYHLSRIRLIGRTLGCQPVCVAATTTNVMLRVNYFMREAFGVWRIWVLGPG